MGQGKERPIKITHLGGGVFGMWEGPHQKDELEFDKKAEKLGKDDWHEVVFRLEDETKTVRFHPDPAQAIWVARGDEHNRPDCPSSESADPLCEFRGVEVSRDGKRLTVCNSNETKCELSFRLNFSKRADNSSNPKIVAFHDPGISNKNGSVGG